MTINERKFLNLLRMNFVKLNFKNYISTSHQAKILFLCIKKANRIKPIRETIADSENIPQNLNKLCSQHAGYVNVAGGWTYIYH
jgi:hypothetical protein